MIKRTISIGTVMILFVSAIMLAGCGPRRFFCATPEERAAMIVKKMTGDLDLTRDQTEKVNRIKDEILEKTKKIRDERESVHSEIKAIMTGATIDRNRVNRFITGREEAYRALKPFFVDKIVEFHDLLTPEQRARVAEKMDKFHNWCGRK